jgi:phosphoserine aminotransferase
MFDWAEKTAVATPFVTDPAQRSQVVATIDFEGVDANKISQVLRENGIVDTESYRKLGRNQMRVATFVSTEPTEFEALTACIDYVLERI